MFSFQKQMFFSSFAGPGLRGGSRCQRALGVGAEPAAEYGEAHSEASTGSRTEALDRRRRAERDSGLASEETKEKTYREAAERSDTYRWVMRLFWGGGVAGRRLRSPWDCCRKTVLGGT